jgi:8-oxo-dGTP diphosphatase
MDLPPTGVPPSRYFVNVEAVIYKEGRYLTILRGSQESHAPGSLAFPGGKVEQAGEAQDVLEETLRREVREEVGLEVGPELVYVESKAFVADDGRPFIDVVFLCYYQRGQPVIGDPGEVARLAWMTADQILSNPTAPAWTRQSVMLAERKRLERQW